MCAQCHGSEAQGIPTMGARLQGNPFVRSASIPDIVRFIREGHAPSAAFPGGMPADGGDASLSAQQLADIAAWLKSLRSTR
jgi:mono/diheme cytochrome c family protein